MDCNGYGCGTGGTVQICLYGDDGTAEHLWAGAPLACVRDTDLRNGVYLRPETFSTPPVLTSGVLYHLHWHNVDPTPAKNYTSVDNVFVWHVTTPRQPTASDTDLAVYSGGTLLPAYSPIFQLNYADGSIQGQGYMECWVQAPADISGAAKVREQFTVSGSERTVSSVSVRVNRASGSSPLTVTLATAAGAVIEQGTIPATNFPLGALVGATSANQPVWGTYVFASPHVLAVGQRYQLMLSAASDTRYQSYGIVKGGMYQFQPPSFFGDGYGQLSTDNGASWTGFTQPGGSVNNSTADLQFYFVTESSD
jgi:hypothetical protein